jgi:hypothetical protein
MKYVSQPEPTSVAFDERMGIEKGDVVRWLKNPDPDKEYVVTDILPYGYDERESMVDMITLGSPYAVWSGETPNSEEIYARRYDLKLLRKGDR